MRQCVFQALALVSKHVTLGHQLSKGAVMTKIAVALIATLVAVSVAGCAGMGKGKAPPPVVTKG